MILATCKIKSNPLAGTASKPIIKKRCVWHCCGLRETQHATRWLGVAIMARTKVDNAMYLPSGIPKNPPPTPSPALLNVYSALPIARHTVSAANEARRKV